MTILTAMLARKGREITPDDVAVAVLSQGADATRAELVRLMAEEYGFYPGRPPYFKGVLWPELAFTLEETARTAARP